MYIVTYSYVVFCASSSWFVCRLKARGTPSIEQDSLQTVDSQDLLYRTMDEN